MPYIPHSETEVRQMLEQIGVTSIDELFADIPGEVRYHEKAPFAGRSENEVVRDRLDGSPRGEGFHRRAEQCVQLGAGVALRSHAFCELANV